AFNCYPHFVWLQICLPYHLRSSFASLDVFRHQSARIGAFFFFFFFITFGTNYRKCLKVVRAC
ncbi:hypothetical protein Csa_023948, partial [Cucumis sativus]